MAARRGLAGLGLALALAVLLGTAVDTGAQGKYPSRPITLICPWGAGGGTDRVARALATQLTRELGQPVTVVNRTGGSGAVGHTVGATAVPDGTTITMVTIEITQMHWLGLTPTSHRDFTPVGMVGVDPASVQVAAGAPWRTLRELIDHVRANPGKVRASGSGRGGAWDIARAGLLRAAGLPGDAISWHPSISAAKALEDLAAGQVQVVTASLPEGAPFIAAGKVRPLAVMADARDEAFPDVPTLKELGIDWTMGGWRGIALPRKAPADIVTVLERALERVVRSPQFAEAMRTGGFHVLWMPAVGFRQFLAAQDEQMGRLMREVGLVK